MDAAHCLEHLLPRRAFEDVPLCPGRDRRDDAVFIIKRGEDDHALAGVMGPHGSKRLDTVHLGHLQVHQHHIGRELGGHLHRLTPAGRFADNIEVGLCAKDGDEPVPKDRMVIDDEDDIRMLLEVRLQRAGYDVVTAADGREGVRLFYSARPDLVILDIAMPVMDGWQVLERLREVSNVPVLMLTAAAQERDKVKGLKAGADDYITKPFSSEELLARVEAALRRSTVGLEEAESNV